MSGIEHALRYTSKWYIDTGETANIHFYCNTCGHDETVELTSPFSKLFQCECPVKMNKEGNVREYISILIAETTESNIE